MGDTDHRVDVGRIPTGIVRINDQAVSDEANILFGGTGGAVEPTAGPPDGSDGPTVEPV